MIYSLAGNHPSLPENGNCWVAPDANLVGQVTLLNATSIWFGATLRGDNEPIIIGPGSNIQENCVLHTDPGFPLNVGENCTIGHGAILHGCTIGNQTLVGMGAVIMNGAVVGKNCQIGAGTLITQGKVIPNGSLVIGTPGRIVLQLDTSEINAVHDAAKSYQKKFEIYRDHLVAG
jgi:carbonic anhydrase/acetyltransferase-like protein (isoleucine patch superfamily)